MNKSKSTIIKTVFLGVFTLIAILNTSDGQTKVDKIDELMSTYAEYGEFNGSVLVAEKGEILYKKGFGLANMEWDIPNQPDTKHRLASITKQFTAMLIVQLVAENKIALDVPISNYLPDYPKKNADRITIHHLLTHTSGIPNYTSFPNYRELMRNPISPAEIVHLFADSTLQFTPGEKHEYSNSGYALLGVIIEKITGKSFEEVLQEKILTPLKMNNTGYDSHRTIIKNRALGYYKRGGTFQNVNYIDMSLAYTAGGIYSTVEDLYLWDQALYTEKLLPKKYMDLIFDKHVPIFGRHYGYGWEIGEMAIGTSEERVQVVNHSGGINGFNTLVTRIPADKSSILLLNNTGGAPLYKISRAIGGILYDKPYDLPKKSIARSLLDVIKKNGMTTALSYYKEIKDSSDYYLDENEMNIAGYDLLQSDRANEAASIFKLNVEAFPNSFNVYDSYGEVLLVLGNKREAIENYKKSVKLNPENEHGIKVLKELGVNISVPKKKDLDLLETDSTWGKEIFHFPLSFAPEINFEGFEDARFPPGWGKIESNEFWSYTFAWSINLNKEPTTSELEVNLQMYFDGLMNVVNKDKEVAIPKTSAIFHEKEKIGNNASFVGVVHIYDAFKTKKTITLNVSVEKNFCEQKNKSIILFRFSPKEFGDDIWQKLNKVKLRANMCDL